MTLLAMIVHCPFDLPERCGSSLGTKYTSKSSSCMRVRKAWSFSAGVIILVETFSVGAATEEDDSVVLNKPRALGRAPPREWRKVVGSKGLGANPVDATEAKH